MNSTIKIHFLPLLILIDVCKTLKSIIDKQKKQKKRTNKDIIFERIYMVIIIVVVILLNICKQSLICLSYQDEIYTEQPVVKLNVHFVTI